MYFYYYNFLYINVYAFNFNIFNFISMPFSLLICQTVQYNILLIKMAAESYNNLVLIGNWMEETLKTEVCT